MVRLCIREVAEGKKISRGELSRRANVTEGVLRDAYRDPGRYNIGLRTLERIAEALGVDICDLFVKEDTKRKLS